MYTARDVFWDQLKTPELPGSSKPEARLLARVELRGEAMIWAVRFLLCSAVAFLCANPSRAVASESSRSGTLVSPSQVEDVKARPTAEAVELEEPGLRYEFAIVHRAVQVTRYGAHGHSASVRMLVESGGEPEILNDKVCWMQAYGAAEWNLAPAGGTLALTAIAGEGGTSPSDIVLQFEGARSLSLDALGNLLIVTDAGDLHQQRPAVINASAAPVDSRYVLLGGNRVAVEVQAQHANEVGGVDARWSGGR
jgi:hypothetical protein